MASGPYLDDIAQLVDAGKVRVAHYIARVSLVLSVTYASSLASGSSPEVGSARMHVALHGQV